MAEENKIIEENGTGENNGTEVNFDELLKGVDINKLLEHESVKTLVQAQSDRRVTQALATAKTKWEAARRAEKSEAEKLKDMTDEQRERYNLDKDKSAFEKEKAKFEHDKLVVETQKQMITAGLPDLASFITGATAEETTENIEAVSNVLSAWKSEQLKNAMRGTVPKDTNPTDKKTMLTAEDIKKMTPAQINEAWKAGKIDTSKL